MHLYVRSEYLKCSLRGSVYWSQETIVAVADDLGTASRMTTEDRRSDPRLAEREQRRVEQTYYIAPIFRKRSQHHLAVYQ
jgi:hypothetical protein